MDIEKKALELDLIARVIGAYHTTRVVGTDANGHILSKPHVRDAFDRLAEADNARHAAEMEAFKREVSEELTAWFDSYRAEVPPQFRRFIIPQPDPLHECLEEALARTGEDLTEHTERLHAALTARGLEIVKKEPSQ